MAKLRIFAACVILGFSALAFAHFWRGKTLSPEEVAARWGRAPLNLESFRKGPAAARASMAHSILLMQKQLKGKFVLDLRKEFGEPDGFYFSDVFPAYLIQEGKTRQDETWQIVFLLDRARKLDKIIVHKNCCDPE
jgi:hypothetical protein